MKIGCLKIKPLSRNRMAGGGEGVGQKQGCPTHKTVLTAMRYISLCNMKKSCFESINS
jgi:hypothetical protein